MSWHYFMLAAGTGLLATVIPSFFVNAGMAKIGATSTAMISNVSPLLTIYFAVVLLGEAVPKLSYLFTADADLVIDPDALAKAGPDAAGVVDAALAALTNLGEWTTDTIQAALRDALVEGLGIKPKFAFGPVRLGITGSNVSPPLFESMELLGRDSSIARLKRLLGLL
ncbi:MAG: EamA family transporter [Actinobacteria bacterium]|nr:EamA family transporter [Actinomycetota bacterium]